MTEKSKDESKEEDSKQEPSKPGRRRQQGYRYYVLRERTALPSKCFLYLSGLFRTIYKVD